MIPPKLYPSPPSSQVGLTRAHSSPTPNNKVVTFFLHRKVVLARLNVCRVFQADSTQKHVVIYCLSVYFSSWNLKLESFYADSKIYSLPTSSILQLDSSRLNVCFSKLTSKLSLYRIAGSLRTIVIHSKSPVMTTGRGSPPPHPLRVAKTGRNNMKEEFTPLLPTGIGERF